MELTRHNFDTVFPKFQELLRTCDFYAFDLEMTGINCVETDNDDAGFSSTAAAGGDPRVENIRFLKKPSELFAAKWAAASTFSPMQIGIALFHRILPMQRIVTSRSQFANDRTLSIFDGWVESNNAVWAKEQIGKQIESIQLTFPAPPSAPSPLSPSSAKKPAPLETDFSLEDLHVIADRYALLKELELLQELIDEVEKEQKVADAQSYRATTFSAHLFPSHYFGDGTLQMSIETTGTFLNEHHMDFNAWVRNSLLFTSRENLVQARLAKLRGVSNKAKTPQEEDAEALATLSHTDAIKLRNLFAILDQFAVDNSGNPNAVLNGAIPFLPDSLHQQLTRKAKSLGLKINKGVVSFGGLSNQKKDGMVGDLLRPATHHGTLLMEALVTSRKPVVVHNSWSDVLFFYRALHSRPLRSYQEFKTAIRTLFPILYDTRTLTTIPCMEQVGRVRGRLEATFQLFQKQQSSQRIRIDAVTLAGTPAIATGAAAHDAGFDAVQTGSLYLYAMSYAKAMRQSPESIARLEGVLPVHASIFSIHLSPSSSSMQQSHDYLIHPRNMPILVAYQDRPGNIAFASIVEKMVNEQGISAVVMNTGDAAVIYVSSVSRPQALTQLQVEFTKRFAGSAALLVDMQVAAFMEKNPDVQFF